MTGHAFRRAAVALLLMAAIATAAPVITGVYGAASWAPAPLPNSGIAQGSIFVLTGSGMGPAAPVQALRYPLPAGEGLGGTRVQVTVGGTTKDCVLMSVTDSQVAAILPSSTPAGTGTVAVTYQGAQASATITVMARNFGLFGLNQSGSGPGVFTDSAYRLRTLINAAHSGDELTAWGTGLGAIAGDDSTLPPPGDLSAGVQVFVGGRAATVVSAGRAGAPGLDQITFQVPAGALGCQVSVAVRVGGITSNFTTLPIAAAGSSVCDDPTTGVAASELQSALNHGELRAAILLLTRMPGAADRANAAFASMDLNTLIRSYGYYPIPSVGSCVVYEYVSERSAIKDPIVPVFLDSGASLQLAGPPGTVPMPRDSSGPYSARLGSAAEHALVPGNYTIQASAGGADVAAFQASLALAAPVTTNLPTTLHRASDLPVTWPASTAGDAVVFFATTHVPTGTPGRNAFAEFWCAAATRAGQFTIPSYVLAALPANGRESADLTGADLAIGSVTVARFTLPGFDAGIFAALDSSTAVIAAIE